MYSNEQDSIIKTVIETWFESTKLDEEENLKKLEDTVYCNDRSVYADELGGWSKDGNTSNQYMYYSSWTRRNNGIPDLSYRHIMRNRDRFTYKDTVNGNGLLKWPVGLLTADEIILAGGTGQNVNNHDYYLYTGQGFWSFSPYRFDYGISVNFSGYDNGRLDGSFTNSSYGVRPVITLSSDVEITGVGTESSPYIAK